eukprot:5251593-Pyramimonas_sp.AAC.1
MDRRESRCPPTQSLALALTGKGCCSVRSGAFLPCRHRLGKVMFGLTALRDASDSTVEKHLARS